jgi:DNA-binding transcriptional MocR family regulator
VATSERVGVRAISALLPDLNQQSGPRYLALSSGLAALLLDGRMAPGARLPSERDLAIALRLSRATVTAAYDELASEGMLSRRRGSGSYLTLPAAARVTGPGARMARERLDSDTIDLSTASLPALPGRVEAALASVTADLSRLTRRNGYEPYGLGELRAQIAARYTQRGAATTADDILITNGAQHGFDLVLRLMVSPGDRVLTELPTYPGALEAIKAHSARAVAVPFGDDDSWDTTAIRNALLQTAPRLAFVIPDFHNPTGALIGGPQRELLLSAARRAGTTVVVDESFIDLDLRPEYTSTTAPTAMATLDGSVISIGSLSKPIWGGLRIGWIRADSDQIQRLAIVRARSDMGGAVIDQLLAQVLLVDLDASIAQRRAELRIKRDALLDALAAELPQWRPTIPAGGLSTWVRLDAPAATPLTHLLEQRGVLITPGSRFAIDGTLERFLRIPFALPVADLQTAVHRIAETWSKLDVDRLPRRNTAALVPA